MGWKKKKIYKNKKSWDTTGIHKFYINNNSIKKWSQRNDTGGNKLTQQVNKRLMHSNTIKKVLMLLQTKHATNAL